MPLLSPAPTFMNDYNFQLERTFVKESSDEIRSLLLDTWPMPILTAHKFPCGVILAGMLVLLLFYCRCYCGE